MRTKILMAVMAVVIALFGSTAFAAAPIWGNAGDQFELPTITETTYTLDTNPDGGVETFLYCFYDSGMGITGITHYQQPTLMSGQSCPLSGTVTTGSVTTHIAPPTARYLGIAGSCKTYTVGIGYQQITYNPITSAWEISAQGISDKTVTQEYCIQYPAPQWSDFFSFFRSFFCGLFPMFCAA